jgi:GNAT superfamily N-acetyltransferase
MVDTGAVEAVRPEPAGPAGRLPAGLDGPRACGPYDLAPVLDLINLVVRTQPAAGAPRPPTMGWDYPHIYNPHNLEDVRIVVHQGRPVASVGNYPTTVRTQRGAIRVGGIDAAGTHPDYRRLGLATLALEDAHARFRELGVQVGPLSTAIVNWYRKLGWERAGQQRALVFDRRNVTFLPKAAGLSVGEDRQSHLDQLCALHNASGLGAIRAPDAFGLLAARRASRIFVARRHGELVAYAPVSGTTVREYGGAAQDVATLLRQVFAAIEQLPAHSTDRLGAQQGQLEMTVLTPAAAEPPGLPALLLGLGIPSALTNLGMLAIVDGPGLFEALGIAARLERRADGWRLGHAGGTLDLTDGEPVKLVFGPERRPNAAPELFPIDFYQWPTDRV